MSDEFIKQALKQASFDFINWKMKREEEERIVAEIDREMAKLSLKIVSLAALCDDIPADIAVSETLNELSKVGLTDAVRSVLRANGGWMEATEVRDQIVKLGVNLQKYQNPLASVHTILGRLSSKELDVAQQRDTKKIVFRWKGPVETVWERLSKLPRDKADKLVAETASTVATGELRKAVMQNVRDLQKQKREKKSKK
jgi:hypothetical protein